MLVFENSQIVFKQINIIAAFPRNWGKAEVSPVGEGIKKLQYTGAERTVLQYHEEAWRKLKSRG